MNIFRFCLIRTIAQTFEFRAFLKLKYKGVLQPNFYNYHYSIKLQQIIDVTEIPAEYPRPEMFRTGAQNTNPKARN